MRLHRLAITAFGPYPDRVEVDLDQLGAAGLFLLHGDTGSGKTTLLDAIAFALFGRVPGVRNEAKRLRCDRADPHTRTEVALDVTIGGARLEIIRNPEYERPKSRGAGTTREKHKVSLRWVSGGPAGHPAEGLTRADEVGQAVIDLLGMSADQFFQVVLLPQGEFARFLRADTAEREDLLERLFDTGRFGSVEDWFARARRDSGAMTRTLEDEVDRRTARVAEAAGIEAHRKADAAWLADLRDRLADQQALTWQEADLAAQRRTAAEATFAQAAQRGERIDRFRRLSGELAELDSNEPARDADRAAIAHARRAAPVIAALTSVNTARAADEAAAEHAESAAESALAAAAAADGTSNGTARDRWQEAADNGWLFAVDGGLPALDRHSEPSEIRAHAARYRESAGSLAPMVEQAALQLRDRASLASAHARLAACEAQSAAAEAELTNLPAIVAELTDRLAAADSAEQRLTASAAQVQAASDIKRAAGLLEQRRAGLATAEAAAKVAVDRHQQAVDARQELTERRIAGMAAELAGSLVDGADCPVCGAQEHPAPASPDASAVSSQAMKAAIAAERAAAATRNRAEADLLEARLAFTREEAAAGGRTKEQADQEWAALDADHRSLKGVAAQREQLAVTLAQHRSMAAAAADQRDRLLAEVTAARIEVARLDTLLAERAAGLEAAAEGFDSVQQRRDHLLVAAASCEEWATLAHTAVATAAALREALSALASATDEAGFASSEEAAAAASVDLAMLAERIRRAEDRRTGVLAQLADPALASVDLTMELDVDGLRLSAADARSEAERTRSRADAAAARCAAVAVAARRLVDAWEELAPAEQADAELAALAEVIAGRGQNHRAISLRAYVLAARLQQVALAAGERLHRMSGGRYTFVHSEAKETRGRSGGLGIDVLDSYSGLVRSTKTLSGGESFLASLSLALGLADVVAAEAGGRVLDTMFIDEGFGTLDADTLDLVMGTLDDLREGGRIVGLVSHVDELRQRIPTRLKVTRSVTGSRVELSVA